MFRYYLFDLDGTVADNGEGIIKCVRHALEYFGIREDSDEALRRFVGPPLDWSFREFYSMSLEQSREAVERYRERYREKGITENALYPGIKELLETVSPKAVCCLATSKPAVFARRILEMHGIEKYFTVIVGAELDGSLVEKSDVITKVLDELHGPSLSEVCMIGDRRQDVFGAKERGISCIGVEYGFAEEGELEDAGADFIVPDVPSLKKLLLDLAEE